VCNEENKKIEEIYDVKSEYKSFDFPKRVKEVLTNFSDRI